MHSISISIAFFRKLHYHFWLEVWRLKVINNKGPPNSFAQENKNSNHNPKLKNDLNANANPIVTTRCL